MGYTWKGMQKIDWEEVESRHENGELAGCFCLYGDGTESVIEEGYLWDNIVKHYENGGEFGREK